MVIFTGWVKWQLYSVDGLCRRSEVLQQTVHAENDFVGLNPDDAGSSLALSDGREVKRQPGLTATVTLPVRICTELPSRCSLG